LHQVYEESARWKAEPNHAPSAQDPARCLPGGLRRTPTPIGREAIPRTRGVVRNGRDWSLGNMPLPADPRDPIDFGSLSPPAGRLTLNISGGAQRRPLDAVVRRGTHESSRNKSLYNHCHLAGYFIHGKVTPRFELRDLAPVEHQRAPLFSTACSKLVEDLATTTPARHEKQNWLSLPVIVLADSCPVRPSVRDSTSSFYDGVGPPGTGAPYFSASSPSFSICICKPYLAAV